MRLSQLKEYIRVGFHDRSDFEGVLQVAALLLKKYKDRFSAAPLTATYRYLRQWAADALPPNPLVAHDTDTRHLRDPAFLVRALRSAIAYEPARNLFSSRAPEMAFCKVIFNVPKSSDQYQCHDQVHQSIPS